MGSLQIRFLLYALVLLLIYTSFVASIELAGTLLSNTTSPNHPRTSLHNNAPDTSNHSTSFVSIQNNITETHIRQGWTPGPDGRGTLGIIWSCCSTIVLCCWTAVCPNVPPRHWSRWRWVYNKTLLFLIGVLGPELVLGLALGQWASARRSVEDFKRSGYPEWSMKHAFLADMGGFVLHPRGWVPFPLNAKQLHYLVDKGYIPYKAVGLDKHVIEDKNKSDGLARFITIFQICWFTANCIGRVIQRLALTTLELTTLSFIVCTWGTYYFWAHKPMDVGSAIVLEPNATIADILLEAGDKGEDTYRSTPLDFVGRDIWSWHLYWTHWVTLIRAFGCIMFRTKRRPINRIPDDNFPPLEFRELAGFSLFSFAYGSIPLFGWNFDFPTNTERIFWRASSLIMISTIIIALIVDNRTKRIVPDSTSDLRRPFSEKNSGKTPRRPCLYIWSKLQRALAYLRNNSAGQYDSALYVPLKVLMPMSIMAFCNIYARISIVVQDFVNLRALPPSAYNTVNWAEVVLHL